MATHQFEQLTSKVQLEAVNLGSDDGEDAPIECNRITPPYLARLLCIPGYDIGSEICRIKVDAID